MGKEEPHSDDEDKGQDPKDNTFTKDNKNPTVESDWKRSSEVWYPCWKCGAETWGLSDQNCCNSCGATLYYDGSEGKLSAAAAKVKDLLDPVIRIIKRGGRSLIAQEKVHFKKYVKRAHKLKFSSVADRFKKDMLFRQQMSDQGWDDVTIKIIDRDAEAPALEDRGRTRDEIEATTCKVWKNVQGRAVDLSLADEKAVGEYGASYQWKKAKNRRGITGVTYAKPPDVDQPTPSSSSTASAWGSSSWGQDWWSSPSTSSWWRQ